MRRPIGWIDKNWQDGKREVRASFRGESIKWQFKPAGENEWDYDSEPTEENWLELEKKIENLCQRGHLYQKELALAQARGVPKKKRG
jgi:carbonic anhydrase